MAMYIAVGLEHCFHIFTCKSCSKLIIKKNQKTYLYKKKINMQIISLFSISEKTYVTLEYLALTLTIHFWHYNTCILFLPIINKN